ncbi:MAG: GTP-binding protein [Planctomycetota bacterium]
MSKTRFLMIGGFLGAGKTTTISRLARHYTDRGMRVGLVTNDQAYGLVDTETLRAQGFDVGEVPGACFCCKFDDLVDTAAALGADNQPDVILTEPVGSCTDLVATVLRPLRHLFGDRYEVAPLVVLCKPEHGRKILGGDSGGFSPQAAYIFMKQLEEAQVIVLNKIDKLSDDQREDTIQLLCEQFPEQQVIATSGVTGEGFEKLTDLLDDEYTPTKPALDIDYDIYAEGEAALGWLNCGVKLTADRHWSLDASVQDMVVCLSDALLAASIEPGHVKVLASAETATAVANWVASDAPVELSVAAKVEVTSADALVNVRVHGDPDQLAALVRTSISEFATPRQFHHEIVDIQYFRPGRPQPTHRYEGITG